MKRTTSGNNTVRRFVPLTTDLYFYPCIDLAEVVEELLGGGLLRHLEDLDPRRGHRGGERLEELRQGIHLADALHLEVDRVSEITEMVEMPLQSGTNVI